jgi:hypothetical protein
MADAPAGPHAGRNPQYVGRNFSSGAALDRNFSSGPVALASALALYLGLTAILLWLSLARTGGEFVYAQDDPYIHLAMARTLAEHGVWGVRPYEFASASSSPLWTLLLAAFWKLGARQVWVPFALNLIFGCILLTFASRVITRLAPEREEGAPVPYVVLPPAAVLAALVLVTPLPTLAFIGMEHTLQALLVLAFLWQAAIRLADQRDDWLRPSVLAAAMVAARYETLFVVFVVGLMLAWQRRWRATFALGMAAAVPVVLFGWYSVAHGGLVLPNSVLMKSGPSRFGSLSSGVSAVVSDWVAVGAIFRRPAQLSLTLAAAILLLLVPVERLAQRRTQLWLGACFLGTSLLHAALVKLEWFFRYEAYLVALGIVAGTGLATLASWPAGKTTRQRRRLHPAVLPLAVLLALPLGERALGALAIAPGAVGNVFEQQVQLGRFFARHYPDGSIAVNDLGAVAWLSGSRILDIVGLASQEVADLKRRRGLTARELQRLVEEHEVEAIAIYEDIFAPILPEGWVKAGEWTIQKNVAVSGSIVAFLAPDEPAASVLRQRLDAFSEALPNGVTWTPGGARLPAELSSRP